ncbi:unnamed protein product, partial [Candidula unifasciata]
MLVDIKGSQLYDQEAGGSGASINSFSLGLTDEVPLDSSRRINEIWIFSIIGALLVGLSGIFPLLVIPLESGPALKHG